MYLSLKLPLLIFSYLSANRVTLRFVKWESPLGLQDPAGEKDVIGYIYLLVSRILSSSIFARAFNVDRGNKRHRSSPNGTRKHFVRVLESIIVIRRTTRDIRSLIFTGTFVAFALTSFSSFFLIFFFFFLLSNDSRGDGDAAKRLKTVGVKTP